MLSPDMMKAAQGMMANMSPEEMQRMTQMAANMDPSVMENMMKNMGGPSAGMDPNQLKEQMKQMGQMSPEQLKQGMSQAQNQMGGQKQYMVSGATRLKDEGNGHIKAGKHAEALQVYNKAVDNIKPYSGDDVTQLRLSLLLNMAMCHLKLKDYKQTVETCEEALAINSKSVKALFRRGLAKFESGQMAEGAADVKLASKLSPDDKTIASELARVEKECQSKGVSSEDISAAHKKAEAAAEAAPKNQSQGSATGGGLGGANMEKAVEQFTANPEMLSQATEAMKNMSSDDLEKMMKNAPLPPGMDAETARKQMEAVTKNPEMLKTAMESMKAMPEEERKKMMSMAGGAGASSGGMPDMSKMSEMLKNPEAMKSAMSAATAMGAADGPEGDMLKKLSENPEMMESMTNMMKNIPPEQMQKMMEMSMKMKGKGDGPPQDPSEMMNDPEMMKAAEEMMKSVSPEMLQNMAKSAGMEIGEGQAKMMSKVMPWLLSAFKVWGYVKRPFKAMFSPKGRIVLAVVILLIAVMQHYYWSSGEAA